MREAEFNLWDLWIRYYKTDITSEVICKNKKLKTNMLGSFNILKKSPIDNVIRILFGVNWNPNILGGILVETEVGFVDVH